MGFRRLAHHRSWFLIGLGTIGLALVVLFTLDFSWDQGIHDDAIYVPTLLGPLAILIVARGITGSWSKRQLRVDVPAGTLQLADGDVKHLDELGAVSIDMTPPDRHGVRTFRLRVQSHGYYLYESVYESETKLRCDALEAAVLQFRIRRVLERPDAEGAFRAGPDAHTEIIELAGTPERARAALAALARRDSDEIRARAGKLAAALTANAP